MERIEQEIERNYEEEDSYRMWKTIDGNLQMNYSMYGSYILPRDSVISPSVFSFTTIILVVMVVIIIMILVVIVVVMLKLRVGWLNKLLVQWPLFLVAVLLSLTV